MKRFTLILAMFCFASLKGFSQVVMVSDCADITTVEKYLPMETITDWYHFSGGFGGSSNYWYSAVGDTLINNLSYRLIELSSSSFFKGYLREDIANKKVYTYNEFSNQESLLYDFSASLGDVIQLAAGSFEVIDIDFVEGAQGELKRWKLDGPGPPIFVIEGIGSEDLFLANTASDPVYGLLCAYSESVKIYGNEKCSPSLRWPTVIDETICSGESLIIGDVEYFESGVYMDTLMTQSGMDSFVTLNLNVLPLNETQFNLSLCEGESIDIAGTIFDETNPLGTIILANASANFCDSILYVSLYFEAIIENSISIVACDGDTIVIGNENFSESGIYTETYTSISGCDSIVNLQLDFYPPQIESDTIYFCEGDSVLVNDHYVNEEGIFTNVYEDVFGCDSTQLTVTEFIQDPECITNTDDLVLLELVLSPNPFGNSIHLRSNQNVQRLTLYNDLGLEILRIENINSQDYTIEGGLLTSGIYLLRIESDDKIITRKIVKK